MPAGNIDIVLRVTQVGGSVIQSVNNQLGNTQQKLAGIQRVSGALLTAGTRLAALGAVITTAFAVPVKCFLHTFRTNRNGHITRLLKGRNFSIHDNRKFDKIRLAPYFRCFSKDPATQ